MSQIKSVSEDQTYIIKSIMTLCNIEVFDADITFGNGKFWSNLPKPLHCFDIDPQTKDTIKADSRSLPLNNGTLTSIMFDPPFLTYIKQGREHNSIMGKRFGGYWKYTELEDHYVKTIVEAHRVLDKKGILVIKCQDIIHNHVLHSTHINIVKWADSLFRLKDLFILPAKHRMDMPQKLNEQTRTQKHARIYHSYFLVLERK
jgi:hypothetical protein